MHTKDLRSKYSANNHTLKENYALKKLESYKALKERHVVKKSLSLLEVSNEEDLITENAVRLILEEIDKDELNKTSQVLSKLNAIAGAASSVPEISSAIKSAAADVNEFTGGGMKALAKRAGSAIQRKFGAKAGSNPILKSLSLLDSLEKGLSAMPAIISNNLPDFDADGGSPEEQAAGDKKKISNMEKAITKGFKPAGFFARLKSMFGKSGGMAYVANAGAIAKAIMKMPAAEIAALAAAASSGPSAADIGSTVKNMAAASKKGSAGDSAGGKSIPISNEKDLALVLAANASGGDSEKAQKAVDDAQKNPKKFTQKFVGEISAKSKQPADVVVKVLGILLKSGKMKASIQESNTLGDKYRDRFAVLSVDDVEKALTLYLESGGSTRKWVQLLLEGPEERSNDEIISAAIELGIKDKEIFARALQGLNKGKGDLFKALGLKEKIKIQPRINNLLSGFEKKLKNSDKGEDSGFDFLAGNYRASVIDKYKDTPVDELPTEEEEFENFKEELLADAGVKAAAEERSTTVEKIVDKYLDKFKGEIEKAIAAALEKLGKEEEIEDAKEELGETLSLDDFDPQQLLDFLVAEFNLEPGEKDAERTLVDLGPNAILEKIKRSNPDKKFDPSPAELSDYVKNTLVPLLKKEDEEKTDEKGKFDFSEVRFNPDSIKSGLETALKDKDVSIENEEQLADEIKKFMAGSDTFKKIAYENKASVEEVVEEFFEQKKEDFLKIANEILDTALDKEDPKKIMGILKDQNVDLSKPEGRKTAIDVLKNQYGATPKVALKYIEEKLIPLADEEKGSPLEKLSSQLSSAGSVDDIVSVLGKMDGNTPLDSKDPKITAASQMAILQKIAKSKKPDDAKKLAGGITEKGNLRKIVTDILTGKGKAAKGKNSDLANELAKQLKDVSPDAIAAILSAIPSFLMAEAARRKNSLLLASRRSYM